MGLLKFQNGPPNTSDNYFAPALSCIGCKTRVKFVESCLKQDRIIFTHEIIVNIYIVYKTNVSDSNKNYPTLRNCLFGPSK